MSVMFTSIIIINVLVLGLIISIRAICHVNKMDFAVSKGKA